MEMTDILLSVLTILLCVGASAFFAGAETAVTGVSPARLFHLIQEGDKRAKKIGELHKDKESLIGALLWLVAIGLGPVIAASRMVWPCCTSVITKPSCSSGTARRRRRSASRST